MSLQTTQSRMMTIMIKREKRMLVTVDLKEDSDDESEVEKEKV